MARFPFIAPPRLRRTPSAFANDDVSTRAAASQLAESINRYWADLGYDAEARVVEMRVLDGRGSADEFGVVSNLRNGVPVRRLPDATQSHSGEAAPDQS